MKLILMRLQVLPEGEESARELLVVPGIPFPDGNLPAIVLRDGNNEGGQYLGIFSPHMVSNPKTEEGDLLLREENLVMSYEEGVRWLSQRTLRANIAVANDLLMQDNRRGRS